MKGNEIIIQNSDDGYIVEMIDFEGNEELTADHIATYEEALLIAHEINRMSEKIYLMDNDSVFQLLDN